MRGRRRPRIGPRWKPRSITDPRFALGCEGVARQIQRHVGGKIKTIRPLEPEAFLGPYRGHTPGEFGWKYHEVVVREGRVYDAFTGFEGLSVEEYKVLWQHRDAIAFGF